MSTWFDDVKAKDPELAAAYSVAGGSDPRNLRKMVKALELHPWQNTAEEKARLAAARFILARRKVAA